MITKCPFCDAMLECAEQPGSVVDCAGCGKAFNAKPFVIDPSVHSETFFKATCHSCRASQKVPFYYNGKHVKCVKCGRQFTALSSSTDDDAVKATPPAMPKPTNPPPPSDPATRESKKPKANSSRPPHEIDGTPVISPSLASDRSISHSQGIVIIVIMMLIGIGWPFFSALKSVPLWEYLTLEKLAESEDVTSVFNDNYAKLACKTVPDISSQLNSLGQQGWELVAVYLEHETAHPNYGNEKYVQGIQPNIRPQKLVCVLKRPKK